MARRKLSGAKLEQLCRMQAEAVLSAEAMAERLCVSVATVQSYLAEPQVQQRVAELAREHKEAGQRLAFSRARWAVGRLIQLSNRDDETGRKALVDLLKLALEKDSPDSSAESAPSQDTNQVTEELTKNWTENEWNIFAKLLADGSEQIPATPTKE